MNAKYTNSFKNLLKTDTVWFVLNERNGDCRKIFGTLMPHLMPSDINLIEDENKICCWNWPHKKLEVFDIEQVVGIL